MTTSHDDRVREQFRLQAGTFDDRGWAARGLEWIVGQLRPGAGDQVLDVAAGAAHLGRALAPHVRHVSALDLTPEMLDQGQRLARSAGLGNMAFLVGNATALPWLDGQFDLVVCRLALHQVADPAAVVREMVRVTRPGGRVGVTDMITEEPVRAETNRLERLRDPSHGTTLTLAEIHDLLAAAGAEVTSTATQDQPLDLEDWMHRTATPEDARAEIRERMRTELDGGPETGLRPSRDADGVLTFVHTWATTVAGIPGFTSNV
ncbi:class I SAM-dependent methyltransferase [Amycolatopsis anabasis]|uniref:class I SAM-dependent methyltransferase n=1 Tax=Amycolatopsis anabasis TaxID=1840409 RepID=UPI00131E37FB|nr:methyltransferase domain-containing protein [Amycolatopsis anabasis]